MRSMQLSWVDSMLQVSWLLKADRLLLYAKELESLPGNGMQFVSFWGQRKHWTEWRRIWQIEKRMLLKKYSLPSSSTTSKPTHPYKD